MFKNSWFFKGNHIEILRLPIIHIIFYSIHPNYDDIIKQIKGGNQKLWRKKHDKIFKTQKFDYNIKDDEIPF